MLFWQCGTFCVCGCVCMSVCMSVCVCECVCDPDEWCVLGHLASPGMCGGVCLCVCGGCVCVCVSVCVVVCVGVVCVCVCVCVWRADIVRVSKPTNGGECVQECFVSSLWCLVV